MPGGLFQFFSPVSAETVLILKYLPFMGNYKNHYWHKRKSLEINLWGKKRWKILWAKEVHKHFLTRYLEPLTHLYFFLSVGEPSGALHRNHGSGAKWLCSLRAVSDLSWSQVPILKGKGFIWLCLNFL